MSLLEKDYAEVEAKYKEVFHPIIRRWGPKLFEFCWRTSGMTACMQEIQKAMSEALLVIKLSPARSECQPIAERFNKGAHALPRIANELYTDLAKMHGWTEADLHECQRDIKRALERAR